MEIRTLESLAHAVAAGELAPDDLVHRVQVDSIADLGYAQLDVARGQRTGISEVIYGAGKTAGQIDGIIRALLGSGQERVLVTRLTDEKAAELCGLGSPVTFHASARCAIAGSLPEPDGNGKVLIVTAGTSDIPVAEEAALTARFLGNRVQVVHDVGVAGIHRLLAHLDEIVSAQVVIAIAGMEGALPSVVAGLASCPVIAVPTSVGYGANFEGLAALLAMMNSCASGISVVNIDNGFGAAYQASLINHLPGRGRNGS